MENNYMTEAITTIHAPPARVWQALTNPDFIKKYMFGSDVVTDWKVGSPITYKGMWQGKPFEDRGQVLQVDPEHTLVVTHYSPLSGVPDTPENYHKVVYELTPQNGNTQVTIRQDNNASPEENQQSHETWQQVLANMKELLES